MGYNYADNYLYASIGTPAKLLRIAADGSSTIVNSFNITGSLNCGDVDDEGYYWGSASGAYWTQIDLRPTSANFSRQVNNGTAVPPYSIIDFAYVPGGGDALYGLGFDSTLGLALGQTYLVRFDRTTHIWTRETNFGQIASSVNATANAWGAVYASDDGYLFGSENNSGEIWRFPLPGANTTAAVKVSNGPKSSSNDGARCIKAANV
ncbi:proline rich protein 5MeD [Pestalotiopsis sp. NC0098]|nr:proline rich protein 5MeD [Pestalotiopsis sp. NC0098]